MTWRTTAIAALLLTAPDGTPTPWTIDRLERDGGGVRFQLGVVGVEKTTLIRSRCDNTYSPPVGHTMPLPGDAIGFIVRAACERR